MTVDRIDVFEGVDCSLQVPDVYSHARFLQFQSARAFSCRAAMTVPCLTG